MSIQNFQEQYVDRYQDTFHKVLVSRMIANYRLESNLTQGDKVHRFALDMSAVQVRTITPLVDRTVDPITNSDESLEITEYKGTTFPVSRWEKTLQKNPDLGLLYGREAGILVAEYVDATILNQVLQATLDFDEGDLTTTTSTGTPITLSLTNVPQMITQAKAKLGNARIRGGNMAWVLDDYALSMVTQHVIGRDTSLADSFYQNGRSGNILGDDVMLSDNLTGESVLTLGTQVVAAETITVGGVVWTARAVPAVAGEFDIGADVDASRVIIQNAINGSATGAESATGYFDVSAADRATLNALRITATDAPAANTLTLVGIGAGRAMNPSMTWASGVVTSHFVHSYYGKKGAIDAVIAAEIDMLMRKEPKQDTMNIFNDVIFGVKTFADGAKKMLDVHIAA